MLQLEFGTSGGPRQLPPRAQNRHEKSFTCWTKAKRDGLDNQISECQLWPPFNVVRILDLRDPGLRNNCKEYTDNANDIREARVLPC